MLFRKIALATCLLAAPAAAQDEKTSFDCAKARQPVERAICGTPELAALDLVMDEIYRAVMKSAEQEIRQNVDRAQKAWLVRRHTACGRAKPDTECISRIYKARIVDLVGTWRAFGNGKGSPITGRYTYRQKGLAGEMFLAELPGGATFVAVDTANTGNNPHTCTLSERVKERRGDLIEYRDAGVSKTCAIQIEVKGNAAVMRESPKDCFDLARHWCGVRGHMLGTYVKR